MAAALPLRERVYQALATAIWGGRTDALTPDEVEETYRLADAALSVTQTDDGAAAPEVSPSLAKAAITPLAAEAPAPSSPLYPALFKLDRHHDVSGVSGTGIVAEGVVWSDGAVAMRWLGDRPSTAAWGNLDDVVETHGHNGATEIRWLDGGAR